MRNRIGVVDVDGRALSTTTERLETTDGRVQEVPPGTSKRGHCLHQVESAGRIPRRILRPSVVARSARGGFEAHDG